MKYVAMSAILVMSVMLIGMAQDEAAVEQTAAEPTQDAGKEATVDAPQTSLLDELEWLVGDWVDQGEDSTVTTSCSWTKNRKFLTSSFRITIDEEVTLEGTQFIGWDPIAGRIRSWTFDSEGGFGEAYWTRDGDQWLAKNSFVLESGERASSVNVYTYVDPDTFRWQSIGREIAGELLPSIPEVTVVRQKADEAQAEQAKKEVSQ